MTYDLTVKDALNLAVKHHQEGRLKEAEVIYRQVLSQFPENPDALHLLGLVAHQVGKNEDSARLISRAIQIKSDEAIYHGNLGMVYDALGKEEESAESYKKALDIAPRYNGAHLAHYNLGIFLKDNGKIEEAIEHFNKAIEIDNNFSEAYWNRGLLLLLIGRYKEGWEDYEYRLRKRDYSKYGQVWDGVSKGKILVISEQGAGDNIQFVRYLPLLNALGNYVILECKKELSRLFENLADKITGNGISEEHDFYIPIMSLAKFFEEIPSKSYINAEKKELGASKDLKVGICWKGSPLQENDKNRSARLEDFLRLKMPGVKLYSLQKGEKIDDKEISCLELGDFYDTASVIESLDLIISVDTSVAHLAGALGTPVWILLCSFPDWRWGLEGSSSRWYGSMRLFRQEKKGDWSSVIEKVKQELEGLRKDGDL